MQLKIMDIAIKQPKTIRSMGQPTLTNLIQNLMETEDPMLMKILLKKQSMKFVTKIESVQQSKTTTMES